MGDGELVRFAGTFVFTGIEVGDVDGSPDRLLGIWVINLGHQLGGGPKSTQAWGISV
jgi:hypothetical protein